MCYLIWSTRWAPALLYILLFYTVGKPKPPNLLVNAEVFLSLSDMSKLHNVNANITKILDNYINVEEQRLHDLRSIRHELSNDFSNLDLLHPLNAFSLIKNLTQAIEAIYHNIDNAATKNVDETLQMLNFLVNSKLVPSDVDFEGAARAIIRVQKYYHLDMKSLSSGSLISKRQTLLMSRSANLGQGIQLTAEDCFKIGEIAHNDGNFHQAIKWFAFALELSGFDIKSSDNNSIETDKHDLVLRCIEYLAWSAYYADRIHFARQVTQKWIELDPNNERARNNLFHYDKKIQDGEMQIDYEEDEIEHELCRGGGTRRSNLYCENHVPASYDRRYNFLAYRTEVLSLVPRIVMFYNFITNTEATYLIDSSRSRLLPSTVETEKGTAPSLAHRVAKTAWLEGSKFDTVSNLQERITHLTQLYVKGSEDLQIVNYGIGGFYDSHNDHGRLDRNQIPPNETMTQLERNERLATFLIYLTDVRAGGGTAFTRIGVTVKPVKNAAVLWYNLLRSGFGDDLTRHCACPVLYGDKWIATQWLRERANIFKRSCTRDQDE